MGLRESLLHRLTSRRNPRSLSAHWRRRRLAPLIQMVEQYHARKGSVRILDVGGTKRYWNVLEADWLHRYNVSVTLANLDSDECVDEPFEFIRADGCDLSRFDNGEFDIVHSNSVIEHITPAERRDRFAAELRRVGKSLFIQTPSFWFPIEPHFVLPAFHWLPRRLRILLRGSFDLGYYPRARTLREAAESVDSIHLLTRGELQRLLPDSRIRRERLAGWTKSYIAIRHGEACGGLPCLTA